MSYRPLGVPPRGAWARHLQAERKKRDLSQIEAFELVYRKVGWSPKSRTAFTKIDKGEATPNEEVAAALAEVFGWPEEQPDQVDDEIDLVGALNRQASAMERQALAFDRLASALEHQASGLTGVMSTWGDLLASLLVEVRAQPSIAATGGGGGSPRSGRSGQGARP